MQEVAEFRGYAEDCRRIARSTTNPDHKRRLLEMATVWDLLADEREQGIRGANRPTADRG
jgi:hypothetical protein